ncbi:MAG TPA: hypothetical protein VFV02_17990, partial [Acidimicrobiales bacterium]|nr:hypothetical protein [Acidimicrobiales bacterium]
QSSPLLSTEAVAYRDSAAASQAFSELASAAAHCPNTYVQGQIAGEPPLKTVFGPKPDTGWANVAGVVRLAYDATVSDQQGQSQEAVAVYLRRGRILLAVYVNDPKNPVAIEGHTTLEGIAQVFAQRLGSLSAAVVS